jgi:hypothetical protein
LIPLHRADRSTPLLQIVNIGANAVAAVWPSTPTTFTLQQNTDLSTTNWVSVGIVPNNDGTNKSVIISPRRREPLFPAQVVVKPEELIHFPHVKRVLQS